MKPFEIPYNFDKHLIDLLVSIDPSGNSFHCIYMPPYRKDYISAKYNYIHRSGTNMREQQEMSKEEYLSHVQNIREKMPNKLMLLLQQNEGCISKEMLKEYIDLGFSKFCVGNIQQAEIIREIYPESEIIGSITMKVMPQDLENSKYKIFNGFVLWFPYNRDFDMITELPNQYRYIMLVNCGCSVYCDGTHHWFSLDEKVKCPKANYPHEMKDIIYIDPKDLYLFEPYISYFKLQGREYTTKEIIQDIFLYRFDYKTFNPNLNNTISLYKKP